MTSVTKMFKKGIIMIRFNVAGKKVLVTMASVCLSVTAAFPVSIGATVSTNQAAQAAQAQAAAQYMTSNPQPAALPKVNTAPVTTQAPIATQATPAVPAETAAAPKAVTVELIIFAGQSNMSGNGGKLRYFHEAITFTDSNSTVYNLNQRLQYLWELQRKIESGQVKNIKEDDPLYPYVGQLAISDKDKLDGFELVRQELRRIKDLHFQQDTFVSEEIKTNIKLLHL